MAFNAGRECGVLVDQYDLSAYFKTADIEQRVNLPDTSTFGATSVRRQVVALKDGSVSLGGLYDPATGAIDAVLSAALGGSSASVVTIGPIGYTNGEPAKLISARESDYRVSSPVDDAVQASATIQADDGVAHGVFLFGLAAITGDADIGSHDNGASSANGGVGHLHVTSVSASDTLDEKIQDSADNAAWADLITFTQVSAASAQRSTVTGTVDQYTRAQHDVTGAAISITAATAFARY